MVRHPSALPAARLCALPLARPSRVARRRVNAAMQERWRRRRRAARRAARFRVRVPQGGGSIWVRAPAGSTPPSSPLAARGHGVLIEAGDVFFARPPVSVPVLSAPPVVHRGRRASRDGVRALGRRRATELAAARGERASTRSAHGAPRRCARAPRIRESPRRWLHGGAHAGPFGAVADRVQSRRAVGAALRAPVNPRHQPRSPRSVNVTRCLAERLAGAGSAAAPPSRRRRK